MQTNIEPGELTITRRTLSDLELLKDDHSFILGHVNNGEQEIIAKYHSEVAPFLYKHCLIHSYDKNDGRMFYNSKEVFLEQMEFTQEQLQKIVKKEVMGALAYEYGIAKEQFEKVWFKMLHSAYKAAQATMTTHLSFG